MKTLARFLLIAFFSVAAHGCSGPQSPSSGSRPLPFIVQLKTVAPPSLEATVDVPALFGNKEQLTRLLADAFYDAGIFELVVTEADTEESRMKPDLTMEITVVGNSFGKGAPKISGAVFSTLAWLFAGHVSWFIDDRRYPRSQVKMALAVYKREEDAVDQKSPVFEEFVPVTDLDLSFSERAQKKNWFFNILIPPFWGDGDAEAAGTSLATKSAAYLANQVKIKILSSMPGRYFTQFNSFATYDEETQQILVVSKEPLTQVIVSCEGREKVFSRNELPQVPSAGAEDFRVRFSKQGTGILGQSIQDYYHIPVSDLPGEALTVTAKSRYLAKQCRWTIFRSPTAATKT